MAADKETRKAKDRVIEVPRSAMRGLRHRLPCEASIPPQLWAGQEDPTSGSVRNAPGLLCQGCARFNSVRHPPPPTFSRSVHSKGLEGDLGVIVCENGWESCSGAWRRHLLLFGLNRSSWKTSGNNGFATETQRHRDTETQRHRDTETQRHRDTETQRREAREILVRDGG
jgi:hypothetical protein